MGWVQAFGGHFNPNHSNHFIEINVMQNFQANYAGFEE